MPAAALQLGQRRLTLPQLWLLVPAAVCLACVQQEAAGFGLHEEHREQCERFRDAGRATCFRRSAHRRMTGDLHLPFLKKQLLKVPLRQEGQGANSNACWLIKSPQHSYL